MPHLWGGPTRADPTLARAAMNSMRLPVGLVHRRDCFVAVPQALRAPFGAARPTGAVAFATLADVQCLCRAWRPRHRGGGLLKPKHWGGIAGPSSQRRKAYVARKGDISNKPEQKFLIAAYRLPGCLAQVHTVFVQVRRWHHRRLYRCTGPCWRGRLGNA